jgi:hypothetical protein
MCSPELYAGICQICFGTLTPENVHRGDDGYIDDVHRGKCAILGGFVPEEHRGEADALIVSIWDATGPAKAEAIKRYYAFVDSIATADFYDDDSPEDKTC